MNAIDAIVEPGYLQTSSQLTWKDHWGAWKVRWGIGRMAYRVQPGLYAIGEPGRSSAILVTGNYKMSFDEVRRQVGGFDLWLLVLDTKGVNVWCAAGKGSFGTQELIQRVSLTGLAKLVDHRTLILPQLGAVGVQAHIVKAFCGFQVVYGPVRAADIPAFLAAGNKKTLEMSRVKFGFWDRLVLTPIELVQGIRWLPLALAIAVLLAMPFDADWVARFSYLAFSLGSAFLVGGLLFPVLLPLLPFRAFAAKGTVLAVVWVAFETLAWLGLGGSLPGAAWQVPMAALGAIPIIGYMAMNFTGATTFTNQTGANLEVKLALPWFGLAAALGIILGIVHVILAWGGNL